MLRLGFDIMRFYREAVRAIDDLRLANVTVVQYLRERGYSDSFRRHFIVPLLAAVWSTPPAMVDVFPVQYFLRFIHNHGLIGPRAFRWRTVTGGSARYVQKLLASGRLRAVTAAPVRSIRRRPFSAVIMLDGCETREYDRVVIACHADEALDLLEDAGHEETEALSSFTYTANRVVLHSDESFLPKSGAARASWNYVTADCRAGNQPLTLTYHLNRLQRLNPDMDFCVSVNPGASIDLSRVMHETELSHPRYTFRTLEGQALLRQIQGERNTYFAGAYMGYGFHEDGYQAGREVAALLGVER
jgi:predicted NAD/FAD-binding protein